MNTFIMANRLYSKLVEIGRLGVPETSKNYESGQLFIHKLFGYRGIILFPWLANIYEAKAFQSRFKKKIGLISGKKPKFHTQKYHYQALIDSRDRGSIINHIEAISLRGNVRSAHRLHSIPGLDYVGQDDILPYTSTEKLPLINQWYDHFFTHHPEETQQFKSKNTLNTWQANNSPWLTLSDVYKTTTENVHVTVIPFYLGYRKTRKTTTYWWKYCIRVVNLGDVAITLRSHHWTIFGMPDSLQFAKGRGILGQEPVLNKETSTFQYCSHVGLNSPYGHMWGTFIMERQDGSLLECNIPLFLLKSKIENEVSKDLEF